MRGQRSWGRAVLADGDPCFLGRKEQQGWGGLPRNLRIGIPRPAATAAPAPTWTRRDVATRTTSTCLCLSATGLHPSRNKGKPRGTFCGEHAPLNKPAAQPRPRPCPVTIALVTTPPPPPGCSSSWCSPANESSSPDSPLTCAGSGSRPGCPLSQRLPGAQLVALGRSPGLVWPLDQPPSSLHWLQRWAWHGHGWLSWYGWLEGTVAGTPFGSASSCWNQQDLIGCG